MKKIIFDCGTRDVTASIGFLVLRVMVGLMMLIGHGIPKISNFTAQKDLFPVPEFLSGVLSPSSSMILCIGAEVGAPVLIILGLATRPAAFVLGLCMVVIAFGYHASAPWFQTTPTLIETKELSILFLIPMFVIILSGAGSFSLDALINKDSKRRRW